ncbi:MAG: hypothetical protein ACXABG_09790 [Promethearchaeota archaeon]|jgi:uncharacterized membrane protein
MTINKKALGIFSLIVGIILLIVGFLGMNAPAGFNLIFIYGFLLPGILFLVIGIIALALHLHSVT